ncbi:unnamed protein product [Adineta steineri]|uniref:NHL repeat-containing protein n=1 Tax=Adineta steineri TaxID=433720 RepID=A0A813R935_9BILA|nr:unnamed protein product [Adineta steineri]
MGVWYGYSGDNERSGDVDGAIGRDESINGENRRGGGIEDDDKNENKAETDDGDNGGDTEGEIVAVGNGQGDQSNQLTLPSDLSFDNEENLYVVDYGNHRIQKYEKI